MENFSESVKSFFVNYFVFSGKSTRAEFWWAMLFVVISSLLLCIMLIIAGEESLTLLFLWSAFVLIPLITLGLRRFNDAGVWIGWYLILFFISFASDIMHYLSTGVSLFLGGEVSGATYADNLPASFFLFTTLAAWLVQCLVALKPSKK